jgi:uncharacterized OB-fold protein
MLELADPIPSIGEIGPRVDGVDIPYWDGLRLGDLRIQRCRECMTWRWAPVWRCAKCGSWDLDWLRVEARGRVYSWIRTCQAFAPEMEPIIPYVTVLVEMPEAGNVRLLGILVGDDGALQIGAEVEGVLQAPSELTNGQAVLRWRLAVPRA